jgi:hypothetical protein
VKTTSITVPVERVDRPNDGGEKRLGKIGLYAGIVLVVPILWAGIVKAVDIYKTPDRVEAMAKQQETQDKEFNDRLTRQEAAQKEMRAGLNRILSAMHLQTIKEDKEKETQP